MTTVMEPPVIAPRRAAERPTIPMFATSAHECDEAQLWDAVEHAVVSRERLFALSVNVHWLQLAADHTEVAALAEGFDLRLIDGKPVQVLARSALGRPVPKLSGADIVPALCERSAERGWRIFFLGGSPGIAGQAAERARSLFPGCQIVGTEAPPAAVVDDERSSRALCRDIDAARPDVLLVAFGQPRQEQWILRHADDLEVPVRAGIGASLDFLAGAIPRAPEWMQRGGLEWAWRLGQEPGRLWRRYLVEDLPMARAIMSTAVRNSVSNRVPFGSPAA